MFEKTKYIDEIFEILTYGTAKLSVIFLYRRIFALKIFRYVTTLAVAVVGAWLVSFLFVIIFQCTPITSQWDSLEIMNQNNCVDQLPFYYANAITDLLTDVMILVLPLPMVARLQMPMKQKMAVTGMFLLGTLVCVTSAMRLAVFLKLVPEFPKHLSDVTYYNTPLGHWSLIEASLSVVSACLPTLRPLFNSSRRKQTSYIHSSSYTSTDALRGGKSNAKYVDVENRRYHPGGIPGKLSALNTHCASAGNPSPIHPPPSARRRDSERQGGVTRFPMLVGHDEDSAHSQESSTLSLKAKSPPLADAPSGPAPRKEVYGPPPPSLASPVSKYNPRLASSASILFTFNPRTINDVYSPIFTPALQYPRPAPPVPDYVQIRERAAASVAAPQQRPRSTHSNKGILGLAAKSGSRPTTAGDNGATTGVSSARNEEKDNIRTYGDDAHTLRPLYKALSRKLFSKQKD